MTRKMQDVATLDSTEAERILEIPQDVNQKNHDGDD